ncbi:MAG: RHS repeat-associated core domain-containing protein [Spirulina sp.]
MPSPPSLPLTPTDRSPSESAALTRLTALLAQQQRMQVEMADDRRRTVTAPDGSQSTYDYDDRGNLIHLTEPNGEQRHFAYDRQNRLTQATHSDGTTTHYTYSDGPHSRLIAIQNGARRYTFRHDAQGRLVQAQQGNAGTVVYRYDDQGHGIEARTDWVSTRTVDPHPQLDQGEESHAIHQTINGVTLTATYGYNAAGQLTTLTLPGSDRPFRFTWTAAEGWPLAVTWDDQPLAQFDYGRSQKTTHLHFANGLTETTQADPIDNRPMQRQVRRGDEILWQRTLTYTEVGQIAADGDRIYHYDDDGRLVQVEADVISRNKETGLGLQATYRYDAVDNRIEHTDAQGTWHYTYGTQNRLHSLTAPDGRQQQFRYDGAGRLRYRQQPTGQWSYRYDDAHQLIEVQYKGDRLAHFTYDHKGRLVLSQTHRGQRRYLYGADDALLAITDSQGQPISTFVRTPLGLLAEIRWHHGQPTIYYSHHDDQGSRHLLTDAEGNVVTQFAYGAYGRPEPWGEVGTETATPGSSPPPAVGDALYTGHLYFAEIGLYYCRARWYDPTLGRFLTPDTYTGCPDDERLVNPLTPAHRQFAARADILDRWLQDFRDRNRYTYCRNDPVNQVDPTGHWSFGGVLLSILGAIWTLPNTLIGLVLEITCLIGEVIRWIVWLFSGGNLTWETVGFDAAASSHLNAFALVFEGGWLGSMPNQLLGITFGNVFFVYKKWRDEPAYQGEALVYPPAYHGRVGIPRNRTLYEHELRHTNQYGWFGPFFLIGLPIWGVYVWDVIVNGYFNAWLERDARAHSQGPTTTTVPPELTTTTPPPTIPEPELPEPEEPEPEEPEPEEPLDDLDAATVYGGYALRRGDRDTGFLYAGASRTAAAGDPLPTAGAIGFVQELQQDLITLGFTLVGTADGDFGRTVEWAVREFQAYAKMPQLAEEAVPPPGVTTAYEDRLSAIANPTPYSGPVSGVVNDPTRVLIKRWVANRWRCPVVISARQVTAGNPGAIFNNHANIWLHNEVTSSSPRMYARDFSGYYALPPGRNANDLQVVGDYVTYLSWDGPRSLPPNHTWTEAELLPESLMGQPLTSLTAAQRSTYKVIRAVSEVECIGFFDSVNAYDNAFISVGPCHWTLGIVSATGVMSEGELCGYLAYLRHHDPATFQQAFEHFGMRVDEDWVAADGTANGAPLFQSSSRKYAGWVALQQEDGSFARLAFTEAEGNYFKTWHWFYRFVMAGRTLAGYRRGMGDMARIRLRDIASTPWSAAAGVPAVPDGSGGTRPATLGDVYTSERAMAWLLRWHIRFPAHVVSGGHEGTTLRNAYQRAAIPLSAGDPSTWGEAQETALLQGLIDQVQAVGNSGFTDTMEYVRDWPRWAGGSNPRGFTLDPTIGTLATTRHSFTFDPTGLPPPP